MLHQYYRAVHDMMLTLLTLYIFFILIFDVIQPSIADDPSQRLLNQTEAVGVVMFLKTDQSQNNQNVKLNLANNPPLKVWCDHMGVSGSNCTCPLFDIMHGTDICRYYTKIPPNYCVTKYVSEAKVILVIIFSVLGILGNLHVIVVRVKYWNHSPHYQLIVGLSTADLLFSMACLVNISFEHYSPCAWIYGVLMCKTLQTLMELSLYVDLGFILIISIERYMGIVHPFTQQRFSKLRTRQMILINIVTSVVLIIPTFIQHNVGKDQICRLQWGSGVQRVYTWVLFIMFFVTPVCVTLFLSYKSVCALRQTTCEPQIMSAMDEKSRSRIVSENRKIMHVLIFLILAFVLLVLPNHLVWIVIVTAESTSKTLYNVMRLFSVVPYSLHVSVNPMIYSMLDKRFREYSKNFLLCRKENRNLCAGNCETYDLTRSRFLTMDEKEACTTV